MLYQFCFNLVLRHLDAEQVHRGSFGALRALTALPRVAQGMRGVLGPREPELRVRVFDREFPGPLGMAAGFDKNAEGPEALAALGFAFVEIGTVTARSQPGNPKPRLFRLPDDRAIVNRMGFNNEGAEAVAERLRAKRERWSARGRAQVLIGVNIGKTKAAPEDQTEADYLASARRFAEVADYLVVNVSSPNTPGLRDLQAVERLRPLLGQVRGALDDAGRPGLPLMVKIAPDLADDDIDAVADLALELGLDGIIATNTTISREGLVSAPEALASAGEGGLSGAPTGARALAVLRRLRSRAGERLVLVAVGGIETPEDAWSRIRAGATLVQGYTGLIYGGPLWPRRMHKGIARLVRAAGYPTLNAAVGTEITETATAATAAAEM